VKVGSFQRAGIFFFLPFLLLTLRAVTLQCLTNTYDLSPTKIQENINNNNFSEKDSEKLLNNIQINDNGESHISTASYNPNSNLYRETDGEWAFVIHLCDRFIVNTFDPSHGACRIPALESSHDMIKCGLMIKEYMYIFYLILVFFFINFIFIILQCCQP
jgi:hypothetical protein